MAQRYRDDVDSRGNVEIRGLRTTRRDAHHLLRCRPLSNETPSRVRADAEKMAISWRRTRLTLRIAFDEKAPERSPLKEDSCVSQGGVRVKKRRYYTRASSQ